MLWVMQIFCGLAPVYLTSDGHLQKCILVGGVPSPCLSRRVPPPSGTILLIHTLTLQHTHLFWLYTHAHTHSHKIFLYSAATMFIIHPDANSPYPYTYLPLITPVSLHIENMVLELTLYIASYFLVFFLFLFLVFVLPYAIFFSTTLILITALLGLELAVKAFHCTSAHDIKTMSVCPWLTATEVQGIQGQLEVWCSWITDEGWEMQLVLFALCHTV